MSRFHPPISRAIWSVFLGVFIVFLGRPVWAAEVAVRASVSRGVSVIGDPVQYQIKITGARRVGEPPEIKVDGLVIRYAGPVENSVTRFSNGVFTSERTITWIYQVVPEKNGTFSIPAANVEADGKSYRTEPVGLTVQPNAGGGGGGGGGTAGEVTATGFAEFVLAKKTAYIGETIPVDLRLYVDARVRWQPVAMPDIAGEGFTKQKMPEPQREQAERNGREYDVLVFKTAITPGRAGKITVGPSEIGYNARIPRARRGGPRSLFDMFDDDVFGDPFFSSVQQMKAKAPAVEIQVKPLPAAGKPASFSGAVGKFQFSAEGTPRQVKIGDPVAMKLRVSGRGNFDRMPAPVLKEATGWRTYPASSAFKAEDEIGYAGTKTFEVAVVPEVRKAAMPVFEFSYFDPLTEKYVTLTSEPAPLTVEAGQAPIAAKAPADSVAAPVAPAPVPPRPNDIAGLRYDHDDVRDFVPIYERRGFWYVQGTVGLAMVVLLGLKLRRSPDARAREVARLRREKAAARTRLHTEELSRGEFLENAARVARIATALSTGMAPEKIEAEEVRAFAQLSEQGQAAIDAIFAERAELHYAGSGRDAEPVSVRERERILAALHELEGSHARQ